jgi:hypothetical protein
MSLIRTPNLTAGHRAYCDEMTDRYLRTSPNRRPRSPGAVTGFAQKPHALDPVAPTAAILDEVAAFEVGRAYLDRHCLIAHDAAQQVDQETSIVVGMAIWFHFPGTSSCRGARKADWN